MIDASKLWEDDYGCSSYQLIIDAMGHENLLQVDDSDYQGDTRVLFKSGAKYGWLQFGWGSCSGCDELQGCGSVGELQQLCDRLEQSVKWFDSKDDARRFFKSHDWEGDYSWHAEEQKQFINRAIEILS